VALAKNEYRPGERGNVMAAFTRLHSSEEFSEILYKKMESINIGIQDLAFYEFCYALENLYPEDGGWESVSLSPMEEIEKLIVSPEFFKSIQMKPKLGEKIVLDKKIEQLTRMLFVGLVQGKYLEAWVTDHFYFDIRGFFFLVRTTYFTDLAIAHFGGRPWATFEQKQKGFERYQGLGYKDFSVANAEVDQCFIECCKTLILARGTPIVMAIAGPTAAGKTEIVARLQQAFKQFGKKITSIEMDNFLLDIEIREEKAMGKDAIHFNLFKQSLEEICRGRNILIPRYDFVEATSSHNLEGNLKPGCAPLEIEAADIIFIEGNFPFQMKELADLIGIKVVYLTDDPIRLKRKWKRDIDYRKKYEPTYFRNRFFRTQFLRAHECYRSLIEVCDMVIDTTGAAIWATPEVASILSRDQ
jgi:uridine kinase